MADNEIWLSEDEEETDHELELSTDPRRFNLSLTYQGGQPGGKISHQDMRPRTRP